MEPSPAKGDRMHQFLFASSENIDARSLVEDCLGQLEDIPATANLGFCYATDSLAWDMREILSALQKAAPAVHWVGTVGVGICVGDREIYDRPALALMIGSLPAADFRVIPDFRGNRDALSRELIDWWQAQPYCFALIHGDPGNPDTPAFINRLAGDQDNLFLNGGLTSSQGGHNPQLADGTTRNGLSGLIEWFIRSHQNLEGTLDCHLPAYFAVAFPGFGFNFEGIIPFRNITRKFRYNFHYAVLISDRCVLGSIYCYDNNDISERITVVIQDCHRWMHQNLFDIFVVLQDEVLFMGP